MKTFLWITIVGSVISVLILLSEVLAASGTPQPLASLRTPAQAECDCSNLKTLQIELRNAMSLQQAFRNKIAELRTMNGDSAQVALKVFAERDARRGLETVPGYKGPSEFDYSPWGENQRTFNFPTEKLCGMSDSAKVKLDQAVAASACDGIGKALRAHEDVHGKMCRSIGYKAYLGMHGADRGQEEVEAYGAQIKVIRAEIAKVLERADVRIETEANTRSQPPPNPVYTALNIENRAVVPMGRAAVSGEMLKLDGEGKQITNATVEGNCRFTAGLPSTLTARASIETDGLEAQIRFTVEGTHPSIGMYCIVDRKSGAGMSMPVSISSGNEPLMKLSLENGAEKVFDQASSEAARILAQGGVKLSGQAKIRLVLCEKSK